MMYLNSQVRRFNSNYFEQMNVTFAKYIRCSTPNDSQGSYETLGYFFSGPSVQHSPGYHSRIIRHKNVQPT